MNIRLTFRQKIIMLPAIAASGAILVLLVAVGFGRKNERELSLIETGYSPSLESSRSMQINLTALQRKMQDAVAASDTTLLFAADSLARDFRATVARDKNNPVVRRAESAQLQASFNAYYVLARGTTNNMITHKSSEDIMGALKSMTAGYNELKNRIDTRIERDRAAIRTAFANARNREETALVVTVMVLLSVVIMLALLSIRVIRDVIATLGEMSGVAGRIADGEIDQTLDYRSNDEIGALAEAFRGMISYIRDIASAADAIARGDLSVSVAPRSPRDVLSQNMRRATQTLQTLVTDTGTLIEAAREGALDRRGRPAQFSGAYAELVSGTNQMLDALAAPINEALQVLERLAERDLSARMTGEYRGEHALLQRAVNTAVENLNQTLLHVATASMQVEHASLQVSDTSQSLAHGAGEQAAALEEVSSSLQELSSMARQNSLNAQEARALSAQARSGAALGVRGMERLTNAMQKIKESSNDTAKIVKTIDAIAFQTNLLALNAAVEAARAGDAGRGFAVVADEVRSLAMRSAEAARNTAQLIEDAVRNAEGGSAINDELLGHLRQIDQQVDRVGIVMGEIAAASDQQRQGVEQITVAMDRINAITQGVAATSEQSASAGAELTCQAEQLKVSVDGFTLLDSGIAATRTLGEMYDAPDPRMNGNANNSSNGAGHANRLAEYISPNGSAKLV